MAVCNIRIGMEKTSGLSQNHILVLKAILENKKITQGQYPEI